MAYDINENNPHSGLYRRFVSCIYLGVSRAKTTLKILPSKERRGYFHILYSAIDNGSLIK